jgi:heterodisulfide reductase subunit C
MEAEMRAFVDSLRKNITAEDVVNLEACLNCKMCGEACAWYLVTGDEKTASNPQNRFYTPDLPALHDGRGTDWRRARTGSHTTVADLQENMRYFWACTACGRCTLACPTGISIRRIVRLARAAYSDSGLSHANPPSDRLSKTPSATATVSA